MPSKEPPKTKELTPHEKGVDERRHAALKELEAEWDRRLKACFDAPDFGERVDRMMDACGRTKKRPIAGSSY
jgi:hypothetical protein